MAGFFDDPAMLAPPRAVKLQFDGGAFVLRSPEPLKPYARCIGEWLEQWARDTPDALFLAERDASGGWRRLSYAQVRKLVGSIAQSLIGLHLPPGRRPPHPTRRPAPAPACSGCPGSWCSPW